MHRPLHKRLFGILAIGVALIATWPARSAQIVMDRPLPAFTRTDAAAWLNSAPLSVAQLHGQVILLDIWTFGCWNCTRSIPWLKALEQRLAGTPFRIIGIHSPEFDHERDAAAVAAAVRKLGLAHPIMLDNDLAYWRALENHYWPVFYVADKRGRLRALYIGETHEGGTQARRIEEQIRALLAEPVPASPP